MILSPKSGVAKLFSIKGQIINILGFDAIRSLRQQLCCCTANVATDNPQTNEHDCVPVKLYFKNRWWHFACTRVTVIEKSNNNFISK